MHEKYGDVVRIAPDEVSFAREEAWVDALGGRKPLPRNPTFFKAGPGQSDYLVTTADSEASIRMRRVISPAFTERALARQEPVARSSDATQGAVVDLVGWFHWFAFDLVGELAFGEAFGCLLSAFAATTRYDAGLELLLLQPIPSGIRRMQDDHFAFAKARVHHRMQSPKRDDFMAPMLEGNSNFEKMSVPKIESTVAVLIPAGSETTATTLCGIRNSLVQSPEQLHRLEKEIRSTFDTEQNISLRALQQLPFLNTVVFEGLRMCNPVAGGVLRRVPEGGSMLRRYFLPKGTHVLINSTAVSFSAANFSPADDSLPERFLPEVMRPPEFRGDRRINQKPFGLGSRSCLGNPFALAEIQLVLVRLI